MKLICVFTIMLVGLIFISGTKEEDSTLDDFDLLGTHGKLELEGEDTTLDDFDPLGTHENLEIEGEHQKRAMDPVNKRKCPPGYYLAGKLDGEDKEPFARLQDEVANLLGTEEDCK